MYKVISIGTKEMDEYLNVNVEEVKKMFPESIKKTDKGSEYLSITIANCLTPSSTHFLVPKCVEYFLNKYKTYEVIDADWENFKFILYK
jgi:hypothetical protein